MISGRYASYSSLEEALKEFELSGYSESCFIISLRFYTSTRTKTLIRLRINPVKDHRGDFLSNGWVETWGRNDPNVEVDIQWLAKQAACSTYEQLDDKFKQVIFGMLKHCDVEITKFDDDEFNLDENVLSCLIREIVQLHEVDAKDAYENANAIINFWNKLKKIGSLFPIEFRVTINFRVGGATHTFYNLESALEFAKMFKMSANENHITLRLHVGKDANNREQIFLVILRRTYNGALIASKFCLLCNQNSLDTNKFNRIAACREFDELDNDIKTKFIKLVDMYELELKDDVDVDVDLE